MASDLYKEEWNEIKTNIKAMYKWGRWECGEFQFAGADLSQSQDRRESKDDEELYVDTVEDLDIDQAKLGTRVAVSLADRQATRQSLGVLSWLATQSLMLPAARVGRLLPSMMAASTRWRRISRTSSGSSAGWQSSR